jgi:hypothetical protein
VTNAATIEAPRLRPRGSNHVGMRQFNERVVLQAIRLNGALPKADIARLTKLTPQTVQVIIARLEADALVRKLEPVRGKVGQPSVPMALNPDGAFTIGIKIGRRSLDMLLLDFAGQVRERASLAYRFPDPDALFAEIQARLRQLRRCRPSCARGCTAWASRHRCRSAAGNRCSASRRARPRSGPRSTSASAWRR